MANGKLAGKVAVVTGAAGGIGFASAQFFAREGASVLLVDREEEPLRKAHEALEGLSAAAIAADVSSLEDTRHYVDEAVRRFGGIDVLFANAGIEGAVAGHPREHAEPGPIENRMMRAIEEKASPGHGDQVKQGFLAKVPMGRYGTNEEMARMALFLASNDSSYCTGAVFLGDGGFVAS